MMISFRSPTDRPPPSNCSSWTEASRYEKYVPSMAAFRTEGQNHDVRGKNIKKHTFDDFPLSSEVAFCGA